MRFLPGLMALAVGFMATAGVRAEEPAAKVLPSADVLAGAEKVELYSLDPADEKKPDPKDKDRFYGWKILGSITVADRKVIKQISADLQAGVAKGADRAKCFDPRHGLRTTSGGKTVDWVICFQCSQLICVTDGERSDYVATAGTAEPLLDKVLKEAKVPLAPKPNENK